MFPISRLQKALRRQGIAVAYADGIYTLSNPHARASVLLPHNFPLEEKAVRQLMAFAALFDVGPEAFIDSLHDDGLCGLWLRVDKARLLRELDDCIALRELGGGLRHAPKALVGTREVIRDPSLGTTGSGNHFVEIQLVDAVMDRHAAYRHGLVPGEVVVMIHSGSRDVGFFVGSRWMDRAKELRDPARGTPRRGSADGVQEDRSRHRRAGGSGLAAIGGAP